MKGVFCFILVALAVIYSCDAKYGVSNLKVTTVSENNCDFGLYHHHSYKYRPWNWDSCTARYDEWTVEETGMIDSHSSKSWKTHESTWAWCYHDGGSYSKCDQYFWEMHVDVVLKPSPDNVRNNTTALRKWEEDNKMEKYFFYRWFYESTFSEARSQCRSRSMEVASFHSHFDFTSKGAVRVNDKYWESVEYIKTALAPLSEQQAKFWINSDKEFPGRAIYFDNTRKYPVRPARSNRDFSFVCEKFN